MISVSDDGAVRTITLDRPDRRNALTVEGLDDLRSAVETADTPVISLRGAGSAFCAGADLDAVAALEDDAAARAFAERGQATARAIETPETVVVAGVDGAARGGGVELALACDLRVATTDATFAETGVRLGLFGAWGGTARLPAVVGQGNAMDLALSGRVIDAQEARRMGLVSRIVDDPNAVAAALAANDHDALGVLKGLLREGGDSQHQEQREAEAFATLHADFQPPDPPDSAETE
jgi:enoyl-CoA hydratase